ncbi:unnamed protein product [Rotaria sordida]|uniref:Uncharacterized protein n=1 Tax=Rotaria sordida TaxID=392033 RepID=A0A814HGY9_9BILA|nr:unnamed protein product [Rotaria sordida]
MNITVIQFVCIGECGYISTIEIFNNNCHFSSSSKRVAELKEYFEFVEEDYLVGITEIDQIKFDQIEKCFAILNLEVDHDKLFKETISLQNTYKEVNSYREPLFVQIEKYVGSHKIEKQIDNEVLEESDDEELVHKTPTQTQTQQDSYHKIRPD